MNDQPFLRNHWSYLLGNVARFLLIGFFVAIGMLSSGPPLPVMVLTVLIILGIGIAMSLIVWLKTKYYFLEDEIVVERTTIFRSETRIQYERLASVVVARPFIFRIFGATVLSFNLNSSVNVLRAEASIVLQKDEAEKLREEVYERIYGTVKADGGEVPEDEPVSTAPDYASMESLVHVTTTDIFLHSFLGMPSAQFAFGMLMLVYSILSTFVFSAISLVAIIIFIFEFFMPAVSKFFRYYDYKIVRDGDTVVISSGLFSTRQDSFKLSKVNFVKVREPFICRVLGMAILEAEVVGTADRDGMPLLCPLKSRQTAIDLFRSLLPEFQCDVEQVHQSRPSMVGIVLTMAVLLAAIIAGSVFILPYIPDEYDLYTYPVAAAMAVAVLLWGHLAYRIRTFAMTDSIALFVTGSYDRISNYILIDKVQFADVTSSPVQRMFGLGRCSVNLLSTAGSTTIVSGIFDAGSLETVSSTVLDRIKDGRYDFRRYQ